MLYTVTTKKTTITALLLLLGVLVGTILLTNPQATTKPDVPQDHVDQTDTPSNEPNSGEENTGESISRAYVNQELSAVNKELKSAFRSAFGKEDLIIDGDPYFHALSAIRKIECLKRLVREGVVKIQASTAVEQSTMKQELLGELQTLLWKSYKEIPTEISIGARQCIRYKIENGSGFGGVVQLESRLERLALALIALKLSFSPDAMKAKKAHAAQAGVLWIPGMTDKELSDQVLDTSIFYGYILETLNALDDGSHRIRSNVPKLIQQTERTGAVDFMQIEHEIQIWEKDPDKRNALKKAHSWLSLLYIELRHYVDLVRCVEAIRVDVDRIATHVPNWTWTDFGKLANATDKEWGDAECYRNAIHAWDYIHRQLLTETQDIKSLYGIIGTDPVLPPRSGSPEEKAKKLIEDRLRQEHFPSTIRRRIRYAVDQYP